MTENSETRDRIVRFTHADLPRIHEIERESMPFGWRPEIFRSCLVGPYECWKIERGSTLNRETVGYYVLYVLSPYAELCNICVDVASQMCGYGTSLLNHAIRRCTANKISVVTLDVRKSNAVAQRLYRRFGFKRVGLRKSYYSSAVGREDAEVMELKLTDAVNEVASEIL